MKSLVHFPTRFAMDMCINGTYVIAAGAFQSQAAVELTEEQHEILFEAIEKACASFCLYENDGKNLSEAERLLSAIYDTGIQKVTN